MSRDEAHVHALLVDVRLQLRGARCALPLDHAWRATLIDVADALTHALHDCERGR
jgi:hypothetical protein